MTYAPTPSTNGGGVWCHWRASVFPARPCRRESPKRSARDKATKGEETTPPAIAAACSGCVSHAAMLQEQAGRTLASQWHLAQRGQAYAWYFGDFAFTHSTKRKPGP